MNMPDSLHPSPSARASLFDGAGSAKSPPSNHPGEEMLIAHASGQLDQGFRVLIEAHLAQCGSCAREMAGLQIPGAQMLKAIQGEPPRSDVWQAIEERLDALPNDPLANTPLPPAARAELTPKAERRVVKLPFSSARVSRLWGDRERGVELLLVSIEAGQIFPDHRHLGSEHVQVLRGGYEDPYGHFEAGDFALYPASTIHAPKVDSDEPCWIITRIEQGVRFSGWRGWLMSLAGL